MDKESLLRLASVEQNENEYLDFKREFTPEKKSAFWVDIVKDIVAFANSSGGVLVFGVDDDGRKSAHDCSLLLELDQATLVDQVRKYTDANHKGLHICEVDRFGITYPCIVVEPISVPLVFTKVGSYEIEPGKQKTVFSVGTIYVRHGTKCEPCNRSDIQNWIDAELARQREQWLGNIRKVVEADPGSTVVVLSASSLPSASPVRLTSDPTAPVVRLQKLSDQYPFRQSDVINSVNKRLAGVTSINSHDIQTIKLYLSISPEETPQYVHKPHEMASPQYTAAFIDLIVTNYESDSGFFVKCRRAWRGY